MAYEIREHQAIPDELLRIWTEEVEFSIQQLEKQRQIEVGIHQARKSLKRIRAILRIVRDPLGEKKFSKANIAYRDAARSVSGLRDLTAMQEVLEKLRSRYNRQILHAGIDSAIAGLDDWILTAKNDIRDQEDIRQEAISILNKSLKKRKTWKKGVDEFSWIDSSIQRTYKHGWEAFRVAKKKPKPLLLHDWRKQVKYLWHQLQLLHGCWPEMIDPWSEELHRLATLLGDEHDLIVLRNHIRQERLISGRVRGKADLLAAIKEYRKELRQAYFPLGEKVYHQKPKNFTESLGVYWEIWRGEG